MDTDLVKMAEFSKFVRGKARNPGRVLVYKWKNWVGAFATVVLLTVSSCASSTPEQKGPAVGATGAAPPPPPAPPPPVQQKLVLRGVHFEFNKANIRPGDTAVLDEAVTTLKANPGVVININGYCDSIGEVPYNHRLSEFRGNAVANSLLNGGIQATQIRVNGYGKTDFVATNATAEGRAQNRRVELVPQQ
jgi:outer membrane protein OmpA-like peptidoglycan-associated protein